MRISVSRWLQAATGHATPSVRRFYAYSGLRWFQLTASLWLLYLVHLGWPLWQVGLAEVAFHLTSLATNLPTGAFADRYGRRTALRVGLAIAATAPVAMLTLAPLSFGWGLLAMAYHALAWSFIGGADQALLYDLAPSKQDFAHFYGRVLAITYASGALGAVAGGWLATHFGWTALYGADGVVQLGALLIVWRLPEPSRTRPDALSAEPQPDSTLGIAARIRMMAVALRQVPGLSGLVLFYGLVSVFINTNHLYGQTTLAAKGAPLLLVTIILAAANLAGALASLLVGRWAARPGFPAVRVLRTATLLLALLLAAVGALPLAGAASAFVVDGVADGTVDPVATATLSRLAPDAVRATVLSAPDTLFSLGMVALFPAAGWLMGARELGIPLTYAVMAGLVLIAGGVPLARWRRADTTPAAAPASSGPG